MSEKKRSNRVQLAMIGLSAGAVILIELLGSGGGDESVNGNVFTTLAQCKNSAKYDGGDCERAYASAAQRDTQEAPRFANREDCEVEFPQAGCHSVSGSSGASLFAPAMAGFLIGGAVGAALAANTLPVYRSCASGSPVTDQNRCAGGTSGATGGGGSRYFTGSGYGVRTTGSGSAAEVSSSAFSARGATATLGRGGFGARAAHASAHG